MGLCYMDETFRKQALEWLDRGNHDIETAQLLYDNRGHTESIAFHIHQALEKYLKGYIIIFGKKPPRIHDLDSLLNHIIPFDKDLSEFMNLCEKVSLYYIESRYPPGTLVQYEYTEIKSDLEKAWEIIRKIRKKLDL